MTAIKLPGQLELPTVIDHQPFRDSFLHQCREKGELGYQIAKLLLDYENRPTSETWSRIQALAAEILK